MEPIVSRTELLYGLSEQEIAALIPLCNQIDTLTLPPFSPRGPLPHTCMLPRKARSSSPQMSTSGQKRRSSVQLSPTLALATHSAGLL